MRLACGLHRGECNSRRTNAIFGGRVCSLYIKYISTFNVNMIFFMKKQKSCTSKSPSFSLPSQAFIILTGIVLFSFERCKYVRNLLQTGSNAIHETYEREDNARAHDLACEYSRVRFFFFFTSRDLGGREMAMRSKHGKVPRQRSKMISSNSGNAVRENLPMPHRSCVGSTYLPGSPG